MKDRVSEGEHSSTIAHNSVSLDPHYNELAISDITVTLDDRLFDLFLSLLRR